MPERRVPDVVRQTGRLDQIWVDKKVLAQRITLVLFVAGSFATAIPSQARCATISAS